MKTKFILLFILIFIFALSPLRAQDGFTAISEAKNAMKDGKKDGKWMEYIDEYNRPTTSAKEAMYYRLAVYIDGRESGMGRIYFKKSGKIYSESLYANGEKNGLVKKYWEGGKLKSEVNFVNDKENGLQKNYSDEGVISFEVFMNNNGKLDWKKIYYNSGKLYTEIPYAEGKENGIEKKYYESGKLMSETTYKDDKVITTKKYNEDGSENK
jgi:antitoxin component YwqK of YwqJK toxin-antitoxin module